ncbi:MAG: hypothetical protein LBK98_06705 [Peptococcaceae bacterium]|jgi:predicted NBD/HSP70 family sugar kinase|nr:hypothetical protein [Peptococcaceae bacterium]
MYIGVAVRGNLVSIGFVADDGEVSFPSTFPIDPEIDSNSIILDLIFNIKTIAETVPLELFNQTLDGVGVSIIGSLDEKNERILECANGGLENIKLRERLERNFDIDVFVGSADMARQYAAGEIVGRSEQEAAIIAAGLLCKYLVQDQDDGEDDEEDN